MYNRHPILPIDIKYDLTDPGSDNVKSDGEPFDIETFRSVVDSAKSLRENFHQQAGQTIKKASKSTKKITIIVTAHQMPHCQSNRRFL